MQPATLYALLATFTFAALAAFLFLQYRKARAKLRDYKPIVDLREETEEAINQLRREKQATEQEIAKARYQFQLD